MPSKQTKHAWKPPSGEGEIQSSKPVTIAEPEHRVGGLGITSSVSLRQSPGNFIQQIRDICLHYVKKTSGKYDKNETAARYVHHMADEIIKQLSGVAAQVKRYESDPDIYQNLLDEWNANFPSSLGAMGTPKAVAQILAKQNIELVDLRDALQQASAKGERDIADVLRSMDAQLQAARSNMISERRQLTLSYQTEVDNYKKLLKDAEDKVKTIADELNKKHFDELKNMENSYESHIVELQSYISKLENQNKDNKNHYEQQYLNYKAKKQQKELDLKSLIKSLQDELKTRGLPMPDNFTPESVDMSVSMTTTVADDEDDNEGITELGKVEDKEEGNKEEKYNEAIVQNKDQVPIYKNKGDDSRLYDSNSPSKSNEIKNNKVHFDRERNNFNIIKNYTKIDKYNYNNDLNDKFNEMNSTIHYLNTSLHECNRATYEYQQNLSKLENDNENLLKQIKDLKYVIEEQRTAMKLNLDYKKDDKMRDILQGSFSVNSRNQVKIIKHTPHLLVKREENKKYTLKM